MLLEGMKLTPESERARDAISNPDDLPNQTRLQAEAVVAAGKALATGATPPLEFVGMGAYGIVFCDDRFAYKVARHRPKSLEDEAEWLETASKNSAVRPHVAKLEHWDRERGVIVRECVRGRVGGWGAAAKVHELWDKIAPYMIAEGWGMPELKENAVIFEERSGRPKIVDAGMASRISDRLLTYVEDILERRRSREDYEDDSTLAFYIRREFGQKEKLDEARAKKLLDRLYALGARRD